MNTLIEASKEYDNLFQGWFKNILSISIAALALLVSLLPTENIGAPDKYFLAIYWMALLLCILSSLLASFRPVILARLNFRLQQELLNKPPETSEIQIKSGMLKPKTQMRLVIFCQVIAIISFCTSFISLGIYALLRTL